MGVGEAECEAIIGWWAETSGAHGPPAEAIFCTSSSKHPSAPNVHIEVSLDQFVELVGAFEDQEGRLRELLDEGRKEEERAGNMLCANRRGVQGQFTTLLNHQRHEKLKASSKTTCLLQEVLTSCFQLLFRLGMRCLDLSPAHSFA